LCNQAWPCSNTDSTLAVIEEASLPIMILWCTINQMIPEIIAIATITASNAAKAFPRRNLSNSLAKGKSEMEIRVANRRGISMLCDTYISHRINTKANRLEAKLIEYGFFEYGTSI